MKLQALLGKQATDADIEEIKAEFHPSNTANVNIVPYEIYDEDGEEIVVGEVRKTIDGVKKKKPLYKMVIVSGSLTAKNGIIATIDISKLKCENYYKFDSIWESDDSMTNTTVFGCNTFTAASDYLRAYLLKQTGEIRYALGSDYPITPGKFRITIVYTKSTDTWTAI